MSSAKKSEASGQKRPGKTSKLAKMNEQERARYLERKMAEEEESKRRKEEMVVSFVKMKIGQEQRFFHVNSAKLVEHWRAILRQCKNAELQTDVKTLVESFSRAMDKKAAHINILMKELDEAEEQYSIAFRSQRELTSQLDDIHRLRIDGILAVHEKNASFVLNSSVKEKETLESEQRSALKYLGDVIIATIQNNESAVDSIKTTYQEIKDDSRNKSMEEKQAVQIYLEEVLEEMWLKMQMSVEAHKKGTEEKRRVYQELLAKDKKGLAEVVENNKRILKLTDDSSKLKETLGDINELEERRLSGLRKEKEELLTKLHHTRRDISKRNAKNGDSQARKLSVLVDALQTKLCDVEKYQEKVMAVMKGVKVPFEMAAANPVGQDRIGMYLNESTLHLMKLKEERRELQRILREDKVALQNHMHDVAKRFN